MKNSEIANLLREIGIYFEMKGVKFKPQAYEKAAVSIEEINEDIEEFFKKNGEKGLEHLPGIGVSIAEKIIEYLQSGKIKELEKFKKEIPVNVEELISVEGIGAKIVYKLYKKLKIKNLKDLEEACKKHKIRKLSGFGEKSEEKIFKSIQFLKQGSGRFILGFAIPLIENLVDYMKKNKFVKKIEVAGSYRRKKETIGDIDILAVSSEPLKVMEHFVKFDEVIHVYARGETKTMVRLKNNIDADLRVVPENSFGAALAYFTGSKEHNIKMRELAMKKGWKLNEYGLYEMQKSNIKMAKKVDKIVFAPKSKRSFDFGKNDNVKIKNDEIQKERLIAGRTEKEIYEKLGMQYVEPEMRENTGEIELALKNKIPKIINYHSIKGDLQVHTNWSEGENTLEEMAEQAQKIGLEYICITDHTKYLKVANGLDEERLLKQIKEINKINSKLLHAVAKQQIWQAGKTQNSKFKILTGAEVNILKDGSLDIEDEILEKLDFVGAAIHTSFNLPKNEQTERIKKAMLNKNVDCIFHPTGRLINKRAGYEIDVNEIIDFAKKTNTILEINAFPNRLDLKDVYIKKCVDAGVKMTIGTDAHHYSHFQFLDLGVSQARRGWAKADDILNTLSLKKFLESLKK